MDILDDRAIAPQVDKASLHRSANSRFNRMLSWLFLIGFFLFLVLRVVLLLPSILDFRNFAFRDLGGFQHVDRLINQGLRPGLDFGFNYGLLAVLLQHLYFALFGPGHWATLGLLAVYWLGMLAFWYLLSREIGQSLLGFCVLLGLCDLMLYFGPWPPTPAHIVQNLSLAYSLYFLANRRLSLALLVAVAGSLSVPSLPIVLSGLLALAIVLAWWVHPPRTVRGLLAQFAPAAAAYAGGVLLMSAFFGWRTVLPTLLPLRGARHYRAMHFGFFRQGKFFWHPPNADLGYYLLTPAAIWILCSALLVAFGCAAALKIVRTGRLAGPSLFILACFALHLFFVFVAFGNSLSYVGYSFILVAGVFAGVSALTSGRLKLALTSLLLVLGLMSQWRGIDDALQNWKNESLARETAGLYSPIDFQPEWKSLLSVAKDRRVFLLSYGNGVDLYEPEIGTPQSWMLLPGLDLPREDAYVLQQIQAADLVVEEFEVAPQYIDRNKPWQAALGDYPLKISGRYFRIWARDPAIAPELLKTATFRAMK
jgi:hypothetical protein